MKIEQIARARPRYASAMETIVPEGWQDFAVASAGAAAALAGLIMVAISVNIKEIISGPGLPGRAGSTIAAVVVIVVAAVAMLVPDQPLWLLGVEIALFGILALALQVRATAAAFGTRVGVSQSQKVGNAILSIGQIVPLLIGAAILIVGESSGLYLVAAGFIAIVIVSMLNAWVLMVEILR